MDAAPAKTERGRNALVSYHYRWDENRRAFSDEPYHDWSSNAADAFEYLAVGHKFARPQLKAPTVEIVQYDREAAAVQWLAS